MNAREDAAITIAFVTTATGYGGPMRSLTSVMAHLGPNINRVLCAPTGRLDSLSNGEVFFDERLVVPSSHRFRTAVWALSAGELAFWLARRRDVVLIVAKGFSGFDLALLGAVLARRPLIVWVHDNWVSNWTRRIFRVFRASQRVSRSAHRLTWITNSEVARGVLETLSPDVAASAVTIPNAIDPRNIRATSHTTSERVRISYFGGPDTRKGIGVVKAVVPNLREPGVQWQLYGNEAGLRRSMGTLLSDNAVGDNVLYSDRVMDMRIAYSQADIVFAPSSMESFGRVVAEAMLNGLPVVASDIPAFRDLLGDNEAGLLFPPGDASAASEAIRELVENPVLREELGARGRERAKQFDPKLVAQEWRSVIRKAASG